MGFGTFSLFQWVETFGGVGIELHYFARGRCESSEIRMNLGCRIILPHSHQNKTRNNNSNPQSQLLFPWVICKYYLIWKKNLEIGKLSRWALNGMMKEVEKCDTHRKGRVQAQQELEWWGHNQREQQLPELGEARSFQRECRLDFWPVKQISVFWLSKLRCRNIS